MLIVNDTDPISQSDFARLIGVSKAAVSGYVKSGLLKRGDPGRTWLRTYLRAIEKAAEEAAPAGLTAARTDLTRVRAEQVRDRLREKQGLLVPTEILRHIAVRYPTAVSERVETLSARVRAISGMTEAAAKVVDEFVAEVAALRDGAGAAFDVELDRSMRERSSRRRSTADDD